MHFFSLLLRQLPLFPFQEKDQEQQIKLVDEANAKLAKTATDAYKELIAKLITEQTGDSPLRFQMDPNL